MRGLIGAATMALIAGDAAAATPSLHWQGVTEVRVLCLVDARSVEDKRLEPELCDRTVRLASEGAPVPVGRAGFGDPALIAPGTMALLVHASVQRSGEPTLLFAIRTRRGGPNADQIFFGAAPRAVRLSARGEDGALDAALRSALAETLPWSASPAGGPDRPVHHRGE
jgi:hypothetical protein